MQIIMIFARIYKLRSNVINMVSEKNTNVIYQHGTLALLVPGFLKGTTTIKELLTRGDTGIGSGEGLDGELIVLDGIAYNVKGDGTIIKVTMDYKVPFANIHFANYQKMNFCQSMSKDEINQQILNSAHISNVFFSIFIKGTFSNVKLRSGHKYNEPYPKLIQAAKAQTEFYKEKIKGILLGYYAPQLFHGSTVAGFHMHFLSEDHLFGGHIIDYYLEEGQVYNQVFDTLTQYFPTNYQEFMQHDFAKDNLMQEIEKAEG